MNGSAGRLALVAIALVAMAWLVLGARSVLLQDDAAAVIDRARTGPISAQELDAGLDDLAAAGRLSPDQGPLVRQGELLLAADREGEARAVAERVTESEPDNLQGWFLAWVAAEPRSAEKIRAKRRVLELNPWFEYALKRR